MSPVKEKQLKFNKFAEKNYETTKLTKQQKIYTKKGIIQANA